MPEACWFELVLSALGLVLIFEAALPLLAPAAWRRAMQRILLLGDGQLRFFGLLCLLAGALLLGLAQA